MGVAASIWLNGSGQKATGNRFAHDVDVSGTSQLSSSREGTLAAVSTQDHSDQQATTKTMPVELARKTSWTNPFQPQLWSSFGWGFDQDSMSTTTEPGSLPPQEPRSAEFLRDWKSMSAALRVTWQEDKARSEAEPLLTLATNSLNSTASLQVALTGDQASVRLVTNGDITPLRQTSIADVDCSEGGRIRLMLAPNRLLVRWNDQLLFNVARPAAITGGQCRFVVTAPPGTRISELRLDGE